MTYLTIKPLRAEVSAVSELMLSEEYETPEALASEIVHRCFELFARRESYALAVQTAGKSEFFWPFLYKGDVERFSRDAFPATTDGERRVVLHMQSPGVQLERATKADYVPQDASDSQSDEGGPIEHKPIG